MYIYSAYVQSVDFFFFNCVAQVVQNINFVFVFFTNNSEHSTYGHQQKTVTITDTLATSQKLLMMKTEIPHIKNNNARILFICAEVLQCNYEAEKL